MVKQRIRSMTGLMLALLMIVSLIAVGETNAYAADSEINITVKDVTNCYDEAKSFLDLLNEQRRERGCEPYEMDKDMMSKAMVRAAEIAVYNGNERPNGSSFSAPESVRGCDIYSVHMFFANMERNSDNYTFMYSKSYRSIGIGVVRVNGTMCFYAYLSAASASPVDASVYSQGETTSNMSMKILKSHIKTVEPVFADGSSIYCGNYFEVPLLLVNEKDTDVSVYLAPTCLNVTVSDTSIFRYENDRMIGLKPGYATIKVSVREYAEANVTFRLYATGKSFDSCTFSNIPDQYYTGSPIKPTVTIKTNTGIQLRSGYDYSLSYSDNTNIGTATVKVSGIGEYAGSVKKLNFKIVSNPYVTFSITAMVPASTFSIGQSAKVSIVTSGAIPPVKYTYEYAPYTSSPTWKTLLRDSTENSCKFKPSEKGNYYFRVSATDSSGKSSSQTIRMTVVDVLKCSATLSQSSVVLGNTVKVTASQTGGASPYRYALYYKLSTDGSWTTHTDFTTSNTFTFKPSDPGTYNLCVKVKSSSDALDKVYLDLKVTGSSLKNTSSVSSTNVSYGGTIKMTGSATGGAGGYQYAFFYKFSSDSSWSTIKDFSSTASASLKASKTGKCNVCIKVKDVTGNIVKKYFEVAVDSPLKNNSTVTSTSINLGQTVTARCAASEGSGTYQYAVYYKKSTDSSWVTKQNYSTTNSVSIKPGAVATYSICVKVKDGKGTIVNKYFTVKVNNPITVSGKVSSSKIVLGQTVTATVSASGGKGGFSYAVYYKKDSDSSWVCASDYSSATSVKIKPGAAVKYNICFKAKDSSGAEAKAYLNITVTPALSNTSKLSSANIKLGSTVTVTCSATGGKSGYTYAVYYKKQSDTKWVTKQDYNSNTSVSIKPAAKTKYNVCVKVKDSMGTIVKKNFLVTVS